MAARSDKSRENRLADLVFRRIHKMHPSPAGGVGSDMAWLAAFAVFCSELSAIEVSFPLKS
jgi:hypothetical protein